MPFTTPPTAVTLTVVQAAHRNILRANDIYFNDLVPAPGAANQVPALSSAAAGSWNQLQAVSFQASAFTTVKIANGTVATADLADGAVGSADLASAVSVQLAPIGLVLLCRAVGEIPGAQGWQRETNLDGRMLIHAGTTFSVTYTEATNYGSAWSHLHAYNFTTGAADVTQTNIAFGSPAITAAEQSHTHAISGNTGSTTWAIPARAYVYMRKAS